MTGSWFDIQSFVYAKEVELQREAKRLRVLREWRDGVMERRAARRRGATEPVARPEAQGRSPAAPPTAGCCA
jgi:hypothetical protein